MAKIGPASRAVTAQYREKSLIPGAFEANAGGGGDWSGPGDEVLRRQRLAERGIIEAAAALTGRGVFFNWRSAERHLAGLPSYAWPVFRALVSAGRRRGWARLDRARIEEQAAVYFFAVPPDVLSTIVAAAAAEYRLGKMWRGRLGREKAQDRRRAKAWFASGEYVALWRAARRRRRLELPP